jgi:very-short-patch-repair endonuclease
MRRPPGPDSLDRNRNLRRFSTDAEKLLWKQLRNRHLENAKFRRQVWLGSYIVDFACIDAALVIEADGGQHDAARDYDERRSMWLASKGFRVLRFWNNEILTNVDGVLTVIAGALREPSPSHSAEEAERAPPSPQMGEGHKGEAK